MSAQRCSSTIAIEVRLRDAPWHLALSAEIIRKPCISTRHHSHLRCCQPRPSHHQLTVDSSKGKQSTRHKWERTVATGKTVWRATLQSIWAGIEMEKLAKNLTKTSLKSARNWAWTRLWSAARAIERIWVNASGSRTQEVQVRWVPDSTSTVRRSAVSPSRVHLAWIRRRRPHRRRWQSTNQIGKVRERSNKASSLPNSKECLA